MDFEIDRAIEILSRVPATLKALLSGLSDPWVYNDYGKDTFSPFDVVGHLIHGERTDWIERAKIILQHGEANPFEPFDRYSMYDQSKGKALGELLDTFASLRKKNIDELKAMRLTSEDLTLRGMHPDLGSVTLRSLIATWVTHDLNHIHQIAKCMAYQFRDAVGPWRPHQGIFREWSGS